MPKPKVKPKKKARPPRKAPAPSANGHLLYPCSFANLNVGDETARLGVAISRGNLTVADADRELCGKRLRATIVARVNGGQAGQGSFPGMDEDIRLSGTIDVGGFSATPKKITAGLTFLLSTIAVSELARFPKREGQLIIVGTEDLPEGAAVAENHPV